MLQGLEIVYLRYSAGFYKKKWVEDFCRSTSLLTMMKLNKIESKVLLTERTLQVIL